MARLGPELTTSLKRAHAAPRDSFYFCLKDRTSVRRLTTPEMGKKDKQKLEHRASQSPYTLPTVRIYQCLALSVKENRNSFHFKVSCDMPAIRKHAQVCSNSCRVYMGFHHLLLRTIVPRPNLLNSDATHS
jgi:hypothetical protein